MNRFAHLPVAETLESRRFMDATLVGGELLITGTEAKDTITVSLDANDPEQLSVKVNKTTYQFPLAEVDTISIEALGGNDKVVVLGNQGAIYTSVKVEGGSGNDVITGGTGNDMLVGGDGNDTINGGDGDDFLFGDAGNDKLTGGSANDYVDGGNGNDSLTGGLNDDTLLAGDGKDKLDAGTGDDNVDGGTGKDAIKTGTGEDAIAEDSTNLKEVKDRGDADADYTLGELTEELSELHEMVVPGSTVFRCELADGLMTLYYRFGEDPTAYKTVLDVSNVADGAPLRDNVNLVSREVSTSELRDSAVAVFNARVPNLGILSFKSVGNGYSGTLGEGAEEIRYRDIYGTIQLMSTDDIVWTLDEAEEDLDNDGIFDNYGQQNEGGIPLDPSWTPFPSGDGRTLYQDLQGNWFEPGNDGLFYPHFSGGQ
ncbi:calcium-binding protein [Humisphaera borealis]|nr:hypothetical protein [Humisphaera borealis]